MLMSKILLTNTLALFLIITANCQTQTDPRSEVEKYYAEAAAGRGYSLPKGTLKEVSAKYLLEVSETKLKSENAKIRYAAIDLLSRKGRLMNPGKERYPFVILLTQAVSDPDGGNNGAALRGLRQFTSSDFNKEAKEKIVARLRVNTMRKDELIKIAGFAGCTNATALIRTAFINNTSEKKKVQWAAHLALARMGDTASFNYCLARIKSEPPSDNVVWYLFPDLVYTKNPEGIRYMLDQVLSDEKKCSSPNPSKEVKIICAFKVMEVVAPAIKNFPLPVDDGDLEIDNYDEALAKVRDWINTNPQLIIDNENY